MQANFACSHDDNFCTASSFACYSVIKDIGQFLKERLSFHVSRLLAQDSLQDSAPRQSFQDSSNGKRCTVFRFVEVT